MPEKEKSYAFVEKKEHDLKEDEGSTVHDKHEYYMYMAWGLTLVAVSLATAGELSHPVRMISSVATGIFFIVGWLNWFWARKWKKDKRST